MEASCAKYTEHRTVTNKVLKWDNPSNPSPRIVRISVTDRYATDSSGDENESSRTTRRRRQQRLEQEQEQRVKKLINEIRIQDRRPNPLVLEPRNDSRDGKKYRGVRQRRSGRWVAEIKHPLSRQRSWLGTFDTAEEAALVYAQAAIRMRGPDALTNFTKPVFHGHASRQDVGVCDGITNKSNLSDEAPAFVDVETDSS